MTFSLITLGCKVNQCDGEALATCLLDAGYQQVPFGKYVADIYLINTCTVTHTVDKKSMQILRRTRRLNPAAFVAVCGCLARKEDVPPIEGADYVFDTRQPQGLLDLLAARFATVMPHGLHDMMDNDIPTVQNKTRVFLKVQDGCDRFCAYCIVPYVRGALSSVPIEEVTKAVATHAASGAKEIVLTGIQLAAYGHNVGENTAKETLADLIRRLTRVHPMPRLRLSSLEPNAVDDDFLDAVAGNPALCAHFHLSLQSGCDATLARMARRYTTADYAQAVYALRKLYPGKGTLSLTTDIIVGFPGETEQDHETSMAFVQQMGFARVHVFPYSPRAGTVAADFADQISPEVKKTRAAQMLALAASMQQDFLAAQVGTTTEVLFETPTAGHTRNYCTVRIAQPTTPNTLAHVSITGFDHEALIGALI